jgi:hypothetical protein
MNRNVPPHLNPGIQNDAGQIEIQVQALLGTQKRQRNLVFEQLADMNTAAPL